MIKEPLVFVGCSDFAGKVRGKAFPAGDFDKRLRRGIGWTPTNVQITCFNAIADSPFGALGDLLLVPDPDTRVQVDFADDSPAEDFLLGDIKHTDGRPWHCCTRTLLRQALERLRATAGLTLLAAFEHEFHFRGPGTAVGNGYSHAGLRAARGYGETLTAALRAAGLTPDTFMQEYGLDQYEVTVAPAVGVAAADQAVILRELVRATAERCGRSASFTPTRDPAGVGNGVHIHMSLLDDAGRPATHDPAGPAGLSGKAGSFVAGVLKYLPSLVALTAPSVVSYTRLTPHRWSAAYNNLGLRDREAAVRICPTSTLNDTPVEAQFNVEFRAGDAAASPYLQLAAVVHAGTQGLEENLPAPDATEQDLSLLSAEQLQQLGPVRLPQTLDEALRALAADATVAGWFPDGVLDVYLKHKQGEMAFLQDKSVAEICALYEQVY